MANQMTGFLDLLQQEYAATVKAQLEAINRFTWGKGTGFRQPKCGEEGLIGFYHLWGPVERHAGRCWQCEGLLIYSDYEDSGIRECDQCNAGYNSTSVSRKCLRCGETQYKSLELKTVDTMSTGRIYVE